MLLCLDSLFRYICKRPRIILQAMHGGRQERWIFKKMPAGAHHGLRLDFVKEMVNLFAYLTCFLVNIKLMATSVNLHLDICEQ